MLGRTFSNLMPPLIGVNKFESVHASEGQKHHGHPQAQELSHHV